MEEGKEKPGAGSGKGSGEGMEEKVERRICEKPGEEIDVESIMQEIRAEIRRKGYKEKEVRFADVNVSYADDRDLDDIAFSVEDYKKQLLLLNIRKNVNTNKTLYADSRAGRLEIFFKKVFRKCARFYVEPIVSEQNEYNETNALLLCRLYAALKKVEELEARVARLENAAKPGVGIEQSENMTEPENGME